MEILKVRNVHRALPDGIDLLIRKGYQRDSRYGRVIKADGPVVTAYGRPQERVCFWEERDCNPFLHLFEALYLIAGRDDVYFLKPFSKRLPEFSDDGKTFFGSYGRRWRSWFKIDQLQIIIDILKKNKDDRRCVLQMWDAPKDLGKSGVDHPCNTHVYFSVSKNNLLDMTVCCRSNDIIWGAYGTNAVTFSILQEYVARGIGVEMGKYYQVSNDYHAYLNVFEPLASLAERASDPFRMLSRNSPYENGIFPTVVVDEELEIWDRDLAMWLADPYKVGIRSKFFLRTATPMWAAHAAYREKKYDEALEIIETKMLEGSDWKAASREWMERRKARL